MSKCAQFAKTVLAGLVKRGLSPQALASCFEYEGGHLPNHDRSVELSRSELVALGKWKLARRPGLVRRLVNLIKQNRPEVARSRTRKALALADKGDAEGAVRELKRLKGVGVALASTILTACRPNNYGIIDRLVCQSLKELIGEPFRAGSESIPTASLYGCYVELLSELCRLTGMTARDWDKALWQMQQRKSRSVPKVCPSTESQSQALTLREKRREWGRRYRQAHPEKVREWGRAYRQRKKRA